MKKPRRQSIADELMWTREYLTEPGREGHRVELTSVGSGRFEHKFKSETEWREWSYSQADCPQKDFLRWYVDGEYLILPQRIVQDDHLLRVRLDDIHSLRVYAPEVTIQKTYWAPEE